MNDGSQPAPTEPGVRSPGSETSLGTALPRTEALLGDLRRSRRRKALSFAVGMLLLLAAAWAAGRDPEGARHAMDSLKNAPARLIMIAMVLPALSWIFTTLCFWSLTRRHGVVGLGEMSALMGSSWLLNFLPLKPGLVGRIAYHKNINNIGVAKSLEVIGSAILCGVVSIAAALLLSTLLQSTTLTPQARGAIMLSPMLAFVALGFIVRRATPRHLGFRGVRLYSLCWRYADLLTWSARYMIAFELIGRPIAPGQAIAIAAVSQAATLLPLIGNGLGIREWAVGLVGSALPAWYAGAAGNPAVSQGLSADLVNRVFEVAVAVPIGVASTAWIAARLRRLGRDAETALTPASDLPSGPAAHQTPDSAPPSVG